MAAKLSQYEDLFKDVPDDPNAMREVQEQIRRDEMQMRSQAGSLQHMMDTGGGGGGGGRRQPAPQDPYSDAMEVEDAFSQAPRRARGTGAGQSSQNDPRLPSTQYGSSTGGNTLAEKCAEIQRQLMQYTDFSRIRCVGALRNELQFYTLASQTTEYTTDLRNFLTQQAHTVAERVNDLVQRIRANLIKHKEYMDALESDAKVQKDVYMAARNQSAKQTISEHVRKRYQIMQDEIARLRNNPGALQSLLTDHQDVSVYGAQQSTQNSTFVLANEIDSKTRYEKLHLLLERRIQYFNLVTYLQKNFSTLRQTDINSKYIPALQNLKQASDSYKAGQEPSVGTLLIQEATEVRPEMLHGVSTWESLKNDQLSRFQHALKCERDYQKSIEQQRDRAYEDSFARVNQYESDIAYLQQHAKDAWTPIPQTEVRQLGQRTQRNVNKNVAAKNLMNLHLIRLVDCASDKYKVTWNIFFNNRTHSGETEFKQSTHPLAYSKFGIEVAPPNTSPSNLHREKIHVILIKKGLFSDSEIGQAQITLAPLEFQATYDGVVDFQHKNKSVGKLEFKIEIYEPVAPVKTVPDQLWITMKYPPLDIKAGLSEFLQKHLPPEWEHENRQPQQAAQQSTQDAQRGPQAVEAPVPPVPPRVPQIQAQSTSEYVQPARVPQQQQPVVNSAPPVTDEKLPNEAPSEHGLFYLFHYENTPGVVRLKQAPPPREPLTQQDVFMPDDPAKAYSERFLSLYSQQLQASELALGEAGLIEEKKFANQLFQITYRASKMLQKALNAGKMTPEDYLKSLLIAIKRDENLLQYYRENGFPEHANFVAAKIRIVRGEYAEIEANIQAQQSQAQAQQAAPSLSDYRMQVEQQQQQQPVGAQEAKLQALLHIPEAPSYQQINAIPPAQYPKGIHSVQDLINVENPQLYACMSYLEKMVALMSDAQQAYNEGPFAAEKKIAEGLFKEFYRQQKVLDRKIEKGELQPQDYANGLQALKARDDVLSAFYAQHGVADYAAFVLARRAMIEQELSDMQQQNLA